MLPTRYFSLLVSLCLFVCGCATTPNESDHYVESIHTLYLSTDKSQFWVRGAAYDYQFATPPELLQVMSNADLAQLDISFEEFEANKDHIGGLIVMKIYQQATAEAKQKIEGMDFYLTPRGYREMDIRLDGKRYVSRHQQDSVGAKTLSREYKILVRNKFHGDYSLLLSPLSVAGEGVGIVMGVAMVPIAIPVGVVGWGAIGIACALDDKHGCR